MNTQTDELNFGILGHGGEVPTHEGYRLAKMIIRNFGGYHGLPQTLIFGIDGTILTGANGSGKTTVIDGLSLLFNTSPTFNAAANAGAGARTIQTYYKGIYEQDQSRGTEVALRSFGDREMTMAISATFIHGTGKKFTIVRLTSFSESGNGTNYYITAEDDISIQDDLPVWFALGALKSKGEARGWNVYSKFEDYILDISETFGFENSTQCRDAFRLLGKSIKQDPIKCVSAFARENILPEKDFSSVMDAAISSVQKGHLQIEAIADSRRKIAALKKLTVRFEDHVIYMSQLSDNQLIEQRLPQFRADLRIKSDQGARDFHYKKLTSLDAELSGVINELSALVKEHTKIEAAIRDSGIDRVKDMRKEQAHLARQIENRSVKIQELSQEFETAKTSLDTSTEETWYTSFSKLEAASEKLKSSLASDISEKETLYGRLHAQKIAVNDIQAQLTSLENSRTALRPELIRARDAIAEQIGSSGESLPFFAELVQIRSGEEAWEGVANRVLNSIGQTIMVPKGDYSAAKRAMNKGKWGAHIRLASVSDVDNRTPAAHNSLASKLMIADDYPYRDAIEERLNKAAFHQCLSHEEFVKSSAAAVTQEGSIQRGAGQAEKNDARNIHDTSTYILGWSVEERIQQVRQRLSIESGSLKELETHYNQWSATITAKEGKLNRLVHRILPEVCDYDVYEVNSLKADLMVIEAELAVIEKSQNLDLLARAEALAQRIDVLNKQKAKVEVSIGVNQTGADNREEEIIKQEKIKAAEAEVHGALTQQQINILFENTAAALECDPSEVDDIVSNSFGGGLDIHEMILKIQQKVVSAAHKVQMSLKDNKDRASTAVDNFRRDHPDEFDHLSSAGLFADTHEAWGLRGEWKDRLDQLESDDLAGAEATQREELLASVRSAPAQLASSIEDFDTSVVRRIAVINDILKDHIFDPVEGTYAKLSLERNRDHIIANFDRRLSEAVAASNNFDGSSDMSAAERVVNLLGGSSDKAQDLAVRKILSDLRNRWNVSVVEYKIDENGAHRTKRNIRNNVGVLSGGQLERMGNLLTGAALSSAFGAHDQFRRPNALLLVILDEAFGKSSKETSQASSDIYKGMGIQMVVAAPSDKLSFDVGFAQQIIEVTSSAGQAIAISQPMSNINLDMEIDI